MAYEVKFKIKSGSTMMPDTIKFNGKTTIDKIKFKYPTIADLSMKATVKDGYIVANNASFDSSNGILTI